MHFLTRCDIGVAVLRRPATSPLLKEFSPGIRVGETKQQLPPKVPTTNHHSWFPHPIPPPGNQ